MCRFSFGVDIMNYPTNYKYTKDHEWVLLENGVARIGITYFAQSELGEVVYVELPAIGKELHAGSPACVVESTKAASDVYAPISGKVVSVNQELNDQPNLLNSDPHSAAWIFELENISEVEVAKLMSAEEYAKLTHA